jgi:hypothetical protein
LWSACGGIEKRLETNLTSYQDITNTLYFLSISSILPLLLAKQDVELEPSLANDSG